MPKTKISEYSTTNTSNSDIEGINIAEGCAPSGINNAIREIMVHLKEFQTGDSGDPLTVAGTFVASGSATINGTTIPASKTLADTNSAQTFTNKIISVDDNTVSGVAASSFVLSNASGNLDGTAAQKAIPSGVVVGTTDSQTLTNKTISGSANTLTNISLTTAVTGTLPVSSGGTGATTAPNARTNLGATTSGSNLFTLTDPSSITFLRINADNTVSALDASSFRTAIGAGSGGGSVLSVDVSGGTTGLTTSGGPVTTTGTITLAGTLSVANGGSGATTLTGVVIGNGTSAFTTKTNPSGSFVGDTDTQTLTNKTLTDPAIIGTVLEDVYTIVDGAAFEIDPGNGSIQLITLGASRTPKATNFAAGEAITLMVDDGTAYTITWTDATFGGSGVVWKTDAGVAPTLNTTGYTAIVLWKVGTQIYGARVGDA